MSIRAVVYHDHPYFKIKKLIETPHFEKTTIFEK